MPSVAARAYLNLPFGRDERPGGFRPRLRRGFYD